MQMPYVPPPGPPLNLSATASSSSQIDLTWGAAIPASAPISFYTIYRRTPDGSWPHIGASATASFSDTGLPANTPQSYYVIATDAKGATGSASNIVSATTFAPLPVAPTGLTVTLTTANSVYLTWNAVPTALSYNLYRNGTKAANLSSPGTVDTGLNASTTYTYAVSAVNGGGEGPGSNTVSATTSSISTNATKLIRGNGFWFDNQYWGGNQQTNYNSHIDSLLADPTIMYIEITVPWGQMSDPALNAQGQQTYTNGFAIVDSVLAKLKTQTTRKVGLIFKMWQAFFATSNLTNTTNFPAWVVNKGNWLLAVSDTNGNKRVVLDYNNDAIWAAMTDMFKAYGDRYNSDDHFLMICMADESDAVSLNVITNPDGSKTTVKILDSTHYCTKYQQMHLDVKAHWPNTFVWVPFNYFPPGGTGSVTSMCAVIEALRQAYPGGYCFGGPDPSIRGTTFQKIVAGAEGTVGDVRGVIALVNHVEEVFLGNGGGSTVAPATIYADAVNNYKAQVCIWNYEVWETYKAADELAAIHAANGVTAATPTEGTYVSP